MVTDDISPRTKTKGVPVTRVSIVMRTRDRSRFVRRALDDLAQQRYLDWELLLVNDGGDPRALTDCIDAAPQSVRDRLVRIEHTTPRGMETASNSALAVARGDYVTVHDDDDTWDAGFLERTVGLLDRHPELDGVVTRTTIVWERIEHDGSIVETGREPLHRDMTELLLSELLRVNLWVPISFVYRRSLHDKLGLYRDDLPVVGDWEFNLRVLSSGADIRFVADEPLANWHQRPGHRGAEGNSVIASNDLHRRKDLSVRDEFLRRYITDVGIGLPLYLARVLDEQNRTLMRTINAQNTQLDELRQILEETRWHVMNSPTRRVARSLRRRLRPGGKP